MARIKIIDLPMDTRLSEEELKTVRGGVFLERKITDVKKRTLPGSFFPLTVVIGATALQESVGSIRLSP